MKLHTLLVFAALLMIGCDKEKFTTKPQLTLTSVSNDHVPFGVGVRFTFDFSDKEGDLVNPVGVLKISSTCADANILDTLSYTFPSIPGSKNTEGELEVIFGPNDLNRFPCHGQDTLETAIFKFWLKDEAGNISDTVVSPEITIQK